MAYKTEGIVLEKSRLYDEAYESFKKGADYIEGVFGQDHVLYKELANLINGSKLRRIYFMNPNHELKSSETSPHKIALEQRKRDIKKKLSRP